MRCVIYEMSSPYNVYINRWNNSFIQPGSVGSVGDVHVTPRLKHSAPELPIRWSRTYSGEGALQAGSNVQDG